VCLSICVQRAAPKASTPFGRTLSLREPAIAADVLAAPHHGARSGLNVKSLALIKPNTVLISAGVENAYGHPYGVAVKVYQEMSKHVFSTHAEGGHCLFTRKTGMDFETKLVTHVRAVPA
jgi:beta-lactamase superfamily II metal-dependent hydrolase